MNYETNGKISVGGNKGSEAHFSLSRERERRKTFKENCKRVEKFIKIQVDFATSSRALEISRWCKKYTAIFSLSSSRDLTISQMTSNLFEPNLGKKVATFHLDTKIPFIKFHYRYPNEPFGFISAKSRPTELSFAILSPRSPFVVLSPMATDFERTGKRVICKLDWRGKSPWVSAQL